MKKKLVLFFITILSISCISLCLFGCGGHVHTFDQQVTTSDYLASERTCNNKAKYFYSCSCGFKGKETFESGYAMGHAYGDWISNGNGTHTKTCANDNSHTITRYCVGGTATETEKPICIDCKTAYGEPLGHVHSLHLTKVDAVVQTCVKKGNIPYYICDCGEWFVDSQAKTLIVDKSSVEIKKDKHNYTITKYDDIEHWYECVCGTQSGHEGHRGGTATALDKAVCKVCNANYGEKLESYNKVTVKNPDWGYEAFRVESKDANIVSATLLDGGDVELYSSSTGTTEVYVYDCFGHKAIIDVEVTGTTLHTITYKANKCTQKFINAFDFNVKDASQTSADQSRNLQSAIDYAYSQGGGTVYLYPGIYNVKILSIREGVTLEMYSGFEKATDGFTPQLAQMIADGKVTVLKKTRLLNNDQYGWGRDASTDFTIRGGVFDREHQGSGTLLLSMANGAVIENVIFKDIVNNHVIQLCGGENMLVKNCIFAGFGYGTSFTREVIQIEPTQPPAFGGTTGTAIQNFEAGEYIPTKNITIEDCYFGASDELPAPHIAIGHHGYMDKANCTGLTIRNNVFDGCTYSAIRLPSVVDVYVYGNKFTADNTTNKLCSEEDPAFIIIYSYDYTVSYNNIVDGSKVTKCFNTEQSGSHNLNFYDNEFTVKEGSDKRIIHVISTGHAPGATYKELIKRQDTYNSTPYLLSGYSKITNFISDVAFYDNNITYFGQPTFDDAFMIFDKVYGVELSDNQIRLHNANFSSFDQNVYGLKFINVISGENANTCRIEVRGTALSAIFLTALDGKVVKVTTSTLTLLTTIAEDGGRVMMEGDSEGNLHVTFIAKEGYKFAGFTDENGTPISSGSIVLSSPSTIRATFTKK